MADGFWGRFVEMLHLCGPQSWPSLFASDEEIRRAQAVVAAAGAAAAESTAAALISTDAAGSRAADEVKAAERLLAAVLHPDTREPIALPFRMAAHVPVNTLLLIGMLGARSPLATGAWQLANQSFNALQFYANRNRSNETPNAVVAASFGAAVASSVTLGVGLRALFNHLEVQTAALAHTAARRRVAVLGGMAVPFIAAASAKPLQIGLMRQDELASGVVVYDDDGAPRGRSVVAGRAAVAMTTFVRIVYLAPMLYLPALNAWMARTVPLLQRSAGARAAANVAVTALSSAYITPACMAIFDQRASLPVEAVEADVGGPARLDGVTRLYFNKGL